MIGIIGAMDVEIEGYLKLMKDRKDVEAGCFEFHTGLLCGRQVAVVKCGVGKVCAAACTTALIMRFAPELVINTGVAGGLLSGEGMKQGDIVVANEVLHHDVDVRNFGYADGQLPGMPARFRCDEAASERLLTAASSLGVGVFRGAIASGDQFICDEAASHGIAQRFSPAAVEMESAAIGQTCHMLKTPFAILRSISDCADSEATQSFDEFTLTAAQNAIKIACECLTDLVL